jgi:hypothetical protein
LLLGMVLTVCTCWFHNMVTLSSRLFSADSLVHDNASVHCLIGPYSLHILACGWAHTISCLFMYCSFANTGHDNIMCSTVSSNCLQNLHMLSVSVCNILPHDIWFVIPVLWYYYYFTFSFTFQISPRQKQERDFANLSILLTHWTRITLLPDFLRTLFVLNFCLFCNRSHLIGLILLQPMLLFYWLH